MKFGKELSEELERTPGWSQYYLNYSHLKALLKEDPVSDDEEENPSEAQASESSAGSAALRKAKKARTKLTEDEESAFIEGLEAENEKILAFHAQHKMHLSHLLSHLLELIESSPIPPDFRTIGEVEHGLSAATEEARRLGRYGRLNYTGFMKILKKHDKRGLYRISPTFVLRLEATSWFRDDLRDELVDLSRCYSRWKTVRGSSGSLGRLHQLAQGTPITSSAQPSGPPREGFVEQSLATLQVDERDEGLVRKTFKYWVHPNNITDLKILLLQYLPVLVFTDKTRSNDPDTAVLNVYLDDDDLSTYNDLATNLTDVSQVRIKWVGQAVPKPHQEVTLELQKSRDAAAREMPERLRLTIKEKYLSGFLDGSWSYADKIAKWRERNTHGSKEELDDLERNARLVQDLILSRRLRPVLRTAYKRTAFQVPGRDNVIASLDTEIKMLREDDFGGKERAGKSWIRKDVAWPYDLLAPGEGIRFDTGILEIRVVYPVGGHAPEWVRGLAGSGLVLETPSFSKYVHGVSQLLPSKCAVLPFWSSALETLDIRHPNRATWGLTAVEEDHHFRQSGDEDEDDDDDGEEDDEESDEEHTRTVSSTETSKPSSGTGASGQSGATTRTLGSTFSFQEWLRDVGQTTGLWAESPDASRAVLGKASIGPKRVAIPVRIEPKVYFANERTLLDWLSFSTVIGGLALGLLNFADPIGQTMGMLFTVVTLGIMWYAVGIYMWRLKKIQSRDPSPYDDRMGPALLVVCLFVCLFTNFYLRYKDVIVGDQP
ncbi:SPX-domain-containing protein [Gonapodya prolifera JEL478]|uniref:SPX-domain-containing protein n=1 Tax=Gonapodya prolifera (strain JEL478) TaxID=1344416 RepID=A0A139AK22_GONPJ|nr:SPX-domain-containing protein [Gonapodya prolifera JEL478]|eukprot:KXS16853.1 SPX-domain-containing protein [Gonapodya prolifera JEL478]